MPVGGRLVNKIGTGIGLATEAYQHHKDSKASSQYHPAVVDSNIAQTQWSTQARGDDAPPDSDESDLDDDESTWALDEASEELSIDPPPYTEFEPEPGRTRSGSKAIEKAYAARFLSAHPRSQIPPSTTPLPVPVVIPQRRPREASRGFVFAYPPLLNEHAGIDQGTFLDFLKAINASCQSSATFDVINMAAFAAMFSPFVISHVASFSARAVSSVGEEAQSRSQRNTFLDKVNTEFFQPRGLWCMIVTWRPQARESRLVDLNVAGNLHSAVGMSNINQYPQPGQTHNFSNVLSSSSGTTSGHMDIGACAPLTYPSLDAAVTSTTPVPAAAQKFSLRSHQDFITAYLDRRSQAAFSSTHSDSALISAPTPIEAAQFATRWSDPNHPTNSGTLLGLLTGGTFDPRATRRVRAAERRAHLRGHDFTDQDRQDARMGRTNRRGKRVEPGQSITGRVGDKVPGGKKGIRRMIHQDVCYLMIVNCPAQH